MRRAATAVAAALLLALTAGAWLVLGGLDWPARAFTAALLVPIPAALGLQALLLDQLPAEEARESVYTSSAASIWVLAGAAMLAARFSEFTRAELWLSAAPPGITALAAAGAFGAGIGIMVIARLLRFPEPEIVSYLIPRSTSEKIAFTGLSISAGIAEELVFRSFLMAALARAFGSLPLAVAASIAVFSVAHAYQGWRGLAQVALLAGILTAPLLLTGSVYPAMAAHAALDIAAGLFLHPLLEPEAPRD